jgi:hypothetical protein
MNRTSTPEALRSEAGRHNGRHSAIQSAACRTREFLADHPLSSSLTSFVIGFGTGLLITACFRSASHRPENAVSRWGHRMRDAVSGVLPHALSK